ncbi:MAG TPA: hypothetical protein VH396_22370 [Chitinophagaceae bacterium]
MFASIWSKYFPVVKILMKKSANSDQVLDFNSIDFERLGKARKAGYKFNIEFVDGKLSNNFGNNELAASLVTELREDTTTNALLSMNNYEFSFNTRLQLSIKNTGKQKDHSEEEINRETSLL